MKYSVKMGVYDYACRDTAIHDINEKFVKVKWVRTKKGSGVRCRLVAERLDELFAGTPSLSAVRLWSTQRRTRATKS